MTALATIETDVSNIIAPIRGQMVETAGGGKDAENLVARIANTLTIAVRQKPELLDCTTESIQTEALKCAADGLIPDGKQAVILPYRNKIRTADGKEVWANEANYQPMVQGIIKRMKDLSEAYSIVVEVVREQDDFHANLSDLEDTRHTYDIFSKVRGSIVGAYCIIRDKDKRVMHREIMPLEDLEKVKQASKSKDSPAWTNWFSEMCRKAVLRRASKFITLDDNRLHDMIQRIDSMFDFQNRVEERADPFSSSFEEPAKIGHNSRATPADTQPTEEITPTTPPEPMTDGERETLLHYAKSVLGTVHGLEMDQPAGQIQENGEAMKRDAEASIKTTEAKEISKQIWMSFTRCLKRDANISDCINYYEKSLGSLS